MGRPKKPPGEARGNTLRIRLTDAERAKIDAEAARHDMDPSAWARAVLLLAVTPVRTGRKR